jgi:hypothetical protein
MIYFFQSKNITLGLSESIFEVSYSFGEAICMLIIELHAIEILL